jgi:beta-galactosidase GanA
MSIFLQIDGHGKDEQSYNLFKIPLETRDMGYELRKLLNQIMSKMNTPEGWINTNNLQDVCVALDKYKIQDTLNQQDTELITLQIKAIPVDNVLMFSLLHGSNLLIPPSKPYLFQCRLCSIVI